MCSELPCNVRQRINQVCGNQSIEAKLRVADGVGQYGRARISFGVDGRSCCRPRLVVEILRRRFMENEYTAKMAIVGFREFLDSSSGTAVVRIGICPMRSTEHEELAGHRTPV